MPQQLNRRKWKGQATLADDVVDQSQAKRILFGQMNTFL